MKFPKVLILLACFLFGIWLITLSKNSLKLKTSEMSFEQLKSYFNVLAKEKGAKAAFALLKTAEVPPDTDMHLLGHVVGDVLYEQEGVAGIKYCTQDFRNACSHSVVVGLFTDQGEAALPQVSQACKMAPGGSGAYTMCFHGLGHGILAYSDYNLRQAIGICQKIAGREEVAQCISGTIMEIISGGDHDKALWSKKRQEYLFPDQPFYPCNSDFMPEVGKSLCYNYLTPYLWEAVGANVNRPTGVDLTRSFALCSQIPAKDLQYQNNCFGGFGKEFTSLVQNKDIRKIDQLTDEQFLKIINLCQLASKDEGVRACLAQALSSIYWGGENERSASIRFCKAMPSKNEQGICFSDLIAQVSFYIKDPSYRQSFCEDLPIEFSSECKRKLT